MNTKKLLTKLILIAAALTFFAVITAGRAEAKKLDDLVYEFVEIYLGTPAYMELASDPGFYTDSSVNGELQNVATRLNAVSKNQRLKDIAVLNTDEVNAFAIAGGHVLMLRGIYQLLDNEDQLACVVGHELGHLEKRHTLKGFIAAIGLEVLTRTMFSKNQEEIQSLAAQYVSYLLQQGYSRENEEEADMLAMQYVRDAGYDPRECVGFMENLLEYQYQNGDGDGFSIFASHPPTKDRIQKMNDWMVANYSPSGTDIDHGGYAIHRPDQGSDDSEENYSDDSGDAEYDYGISDSDSGDTTYNIGDSSFSSQDVTDYVSNLSSILSRGDEQEFISFVENNRDLSALTVETLRKMAAEEPDEDTASSYKLVADAIEAVLNGNY